MSSNLDNHKSSVRDIAKLFAEEKRLGTKAADLVNGTALTKCLEINEAFEVLGTPAEQRVAMLASTVFCADTPHGTVVKQAISTQIRKHKERVPLPEIPPPNIPPREPTPEQLSLINYQNQLQRDSNRVAMRQYNNTLYKATLRYIVSKWVPYSAAMRLLGDWNNMQSQKNYTAIEMASRIECKAELLNLIADAPEGNILNIPAWAPERLLKQNKEMLLPLERITEAAKVSKLVTCMSNQEVARRILLDHDNWQDAKPNRT